MDKQKRKNTPQRSKMNLLHLVLPSIAFLILVAPSFLAQELVAYLLADKLIYPLAYAGVMIHLHIILGITLLTVWITIRLIVYRKFIRELLFSVVFFMIALLFMSFSVPLFETVKSTTVEGKSYFLRHARVNDFSTKMWEEPNGHYIFVHRCDSIGLQCETVFTERRSPLPQYEINYEFYEDNNQLLLVYHTPHSGQAENLAAIIEENLEDQ